VNYFWKIAKAGSLSQQENVQTSAFFAAKTLTSQFESSFSASKNGASTQNPVNI